MRISRIHFSQPLHEFQRFRRMSFRKNQKQLILPTQHFFSTPHPKDKKLDKLQQSKVYRQQEELIVDLFAKHCLHKDRELSLLERRERKMQGYGRVSSESYGVWFPENQEYEDAKLYEKYILKNQSQPALELGCGDGRLLIPYAKKGLQVEGVDLSPHMLERCRMKAEKHGLKLNLYQQAMQQLNIPKQYGTLFIPFGSFMLIHDEKEALEALRRFYLHLKPEGSLLISLFILTDHDIYVSAPIQDEWRLRREGIRSDGMTIQCWEKAKFDRHQQLEYSEYRYDILDQGTIISTEHETLKMRWYTQEQFHRLLKEVGFSAIKVLKGYTDEIASPEDVEFTFVCQKPSKISGEL